MNKYIVLFLCVSLSAVLCEYLNKEEGDECEWEGLIGRCVKESRCLTTLDDDSPKHPVCSKPFDEKIICCTDCNLVNSTKNAIFIPPSGLLWKNGQKARDNCLQYLRDLPYKCKEDGYYAGITRELDEDNGCYEYSEWEVGSSSSEIKKPRVEYPYKVLLGSTDDPSYWTTGSFIISDKYIVTAASTEALLKLGWSSLKFVAASVSSRKNKTNWQIHVIKRFIKHPEYEVVNNKLHFNDIALIETETPIKFNENVLPACLHVEEDAAVEDAITAPFLSWCDVAYNFTDQTVEQTIKLKECSEDECQYDHKTQICYDSKTNKSDLPFGCKYSGPDSAMITTRFSSCVHTAIGVYNNPLNNAEHEICRFFTKVSHYVPWIESIVWPD